MCIVYKNRYSVAITDLKRSSPINTHIQTHRNIEHPMKQPIYIKDLLKIIWNFLTI